MESLTAVRPAHRFDEAALAQYLKAHVTGFEGPLEVRQFEGGQSNPTFLLTTPGAQYVLRKKPPGQLLPSAHLVDREYRIMSALRGTGVPVPDMLALCTDDSVIGTAFYVMSFMRGRVFRHPSLPGASPGDRRAMYQHLIEVLARLHSVDWKAVGLEGYGKPGNYYARQIARWSQQYLAAKTDELPSMDRLMEWLPANIPAADETTIVHGDYRVENMIFHPDEPRVVAVIDWELSTLGHPLADVAYSCLSYHVDPALIGSLQEDLDTDGVPDEQAFIAEYCRQTGRTGIDHWNFYVAFSLFRLASILQGVYARGLQGNASSESALRRGAAAKRMADRGWEVASTQ